ncbi:MAG: PorP/SprF family type IX secretion system membrane protein [Prevotellaceae bacterium]|jgi:type IX secretion system PorP/SprF family membrane protein|nr:PorP/SprF family type IX secretion system membrane protein [Prevotellaceae bacterium]
MKKTLLSLILACFAIGNVMSQEEKIVYDLYHFNYYFMNPAVAGAERCGHFMLTDRHQWVGIKDAPNTQTFSYRSRPWENVGVGGYIYKDSNGRDNFLGGQLSFAYHIPMSDGARYRQSVELDRQLSFGVSVKFNQRSFDLSDIQGNDPALEADNAFYPNANVGVYYTSYGFFTGLSVTNLVPTSLDIFGKNEPDMPLTGLFFIGNSFKLGTTTSLEPSIMARGSDMHGIITDLNVKFTQDVSNDFSYYALVSFRESIDLRSEKDKTVEDYQALRIMPMIGIRYDKWNFAYGCGIDMNNMRNENAGSHQFMIGYTMCIPKQFCR